MWYFRSPEIVFGEDALDHLTYLHGQRALIVTDGLMVEFGFVDLVQGKLAQANIECIVFDQVEPEPSLQMWILYERPDLAPEEINPFDDLGLRQKARLVAIPTTSGTGSETTWAVVLTDTQEQRKLSTGAPECTPDIAIVDPLFAVHMPPRLTADTGLDALTHAIEGYTSSWHNDFADGLCLKAVQMIFTYLPRAFANSDDMEAREKMHNAATLAGLGFINSLAAAAHALGHSLGAVFQIPHGRAVALLLPYTIQFNTLGDQPNRYTDMARLLNLPGADEHEGATSLVSAFATHLEKLVDNAEMDATIIASARDLTTDDTRRLFEYAYKGKDIDF
jgi:alcohol dehydrogenase class IV